jgi:hypothetical protein
VSNGHKKWMVAGGGIPVDSEGEEPRCTSRDELRILNTSRRAATVRFTIYFEESPPQGPYELEVDAERLRIVRVNDLIDPLPVPLGVAYGMVLESNVPVALHMQRIDTSPFRLPTLMLPTTPL